MKEGWEVKKLGEVCDLINGYAFKSGMFRQEGEAILRISNIQNGLVDLSDVVYFSKADYPRVNLDKFVVLPDDIVVALSGATTGKFGINRTDKILYLNQRVAICREKASTLNHLFLLHYLKTLSKSFLESAEGVAQPNLSTEKIKQYLIPVPPLPTQERIVSELDCINSIIEKKREQLKELDALALSIFYDMFGDPIHNEKGWEVRKLGEVAKLKAGKSIKASELSEEYTDGLYPCYGGNGIRGYIQKKSHEGTLPIIGRQGALCGNVVLARNEFYATEHAVVCTPIISIDNIWLYWALLFCKLNRFAQGVAQPGISVGVINEMLLPLPPLPLQQSFASKIEAIEKQKELIKRSIAETETLLASRMQYYFG
ncbi:MAG: restriction endonuclease subunit S [Bacteroidaceae bacterium]|nr:restriction endonuclease subunit S [Bacteroidaceae bacterium]